jgi:hypothetical protein
MLCFFPHSADIPNPRLGCAAVSAWFHVEDCFVFQTDRQMTDLIVNYCERINVEAEFHNTLRLKSSEKKWYRHLGVPNPHARTSGQQRNAVMEVMRTIPRLTSGLSILHDCTKMFINTS